MATAKKSVDEMSFDERRDHYQKTLRLFGFVPDSSVVAATKRQLYLISSLVSEIDKKDRAIKNRLHLLRLVDNRVLNTVEASAVIHELLDIKHKDTPHAFAPKITKDDISSFKATTQKAALAALEKSEA